MLPAHLQRACMLELCNRQYLGNNAFSKCGRAEATGHNGSNSECSAQSEADVCEYNAMIA